MKARRSDLIARGLFWTALGLFGLFQILPFSWRSEVRGQWEAEGYGWEAWALLPRVLKEPGSLEPILMVFLCCFFLSVLLVLLGPFWVGVISRSRVLWWAAALVSGLVACGLTGLFGYHYLWMHFLHGAGSPGPGAVALASYPLLVLLGVIWTRQHDDQAGAGAHDGSSAD